MKSIIFAMLAVLFATSLAAKEEYQTINAGEACLTGFLNALQLSEPVRIKSSSVIRSESSQSACVKQAIKQDNVIV